MSNMTDKRVAVIRELYHNGQIEGLSLFGLSRMSQEKFEEFINAALQVPAGKYAPASDDLKAKVQELIHSGRISIGEDNLDFMTERTAEGFLWLGKPNKQRTAEMISAAQYMTLLEFKAKGLLKNYRKANLRLLDCNEAAALIKECEQSLLNRN